MVVVDVVCNSREGGKRKKKKRHVAYDVLVERDAVDFGDGLLHVSSAVECAPTHGVGQLHLQLGRQRPVPVT